MEWQARPGSDYGWWGLIGLLFLLAAVVVPWHPDRSPEALRIQAERGLARIRAYYHRYREDVGAWPPFYLGDQSYQVPVSGIHSLLFNHLERAGWNGPYAGPETIARIEESGEEFDPGKVAEYRDPWGHPVMAFYYRRNGWMGPHGGILLVSAGPNRRVDTGDRLLAQSRVRGDDLLLVVTDHLDRPLLDGEPPPR